MSFTGFQIGFAPGPVFKDLGALVRAAEAEAVGWSASKERRAPLYGVLADGPAAGGLQRLGEIVVTSQTVQLPEIDPDV